MKRALVIGCPGSGKSTFARALGEKTGIPVVHLDLLFWNADRTSVERPVFLARLEEAMAQNRWIIDGNFSNTMERRMTVCDAVFFLDYPAEVCLAGVRGRIGTARPDMPWVETEEDGEFMDFIRSFAEERRPQILRLVERYPDKETHIFRCREEATQYLETLETDL